MSLSFARAAALAAAVLAGPGTAAGEQPVVIGAGGVTGLYFPVSGAVADVVEAHAPDGPPVTVESTGGSTENLVRLRLGDLDFAVVRSDVLQDAAAGTGAFSGTEPFDAVRAVFQLHPEPLTVIARADAGIAGIADLDGARVNLGPPGTATRRLFERVLEAHGLAPDEDPGGVGEVALLDQVAALCDGRFDAVAFIAGHPSGTIHGALTACDTVVVPVAGPEADRLVAEDAALVAAPVPGGLYPGVPDPVPSLGPVAVLAATTDTDAALVEAVARAVVGNAADLQARHPALRGLTPGRMAADDPPVPSHSGAERYYSEAGLR